MARPSKYATAKEAAEHNLYSKVLGSRLGLDLESFIEIATSKCHCCGRAPTEQLSVCRKDDSYVLDWNYIIDGKPTCGTCKKLAIHFDMDRIVKHCARIMAKRMHDKRRAKKQVSPEAGITLMGRSEVK